MQDHAAFASVFVLLFQSLHPLNLVRANQKKRNAIEAFLSCNDIQSIPSAPSYVVVYHQYEG